MPLLSDDELAKLDRQVKEEQRKRRRLNDLDSTEEDLKSGRFPEEYYFRRMPENMVKKFNKLVLILIEEEREEILK